MKFSHLPYEIQVADQQIHDDMSRGPITLTASQILQQSSNVGTVEIARQVGPDTLYDWIAPVRLRARDARWASVRRGQRRLVMKPEDWYGSSIGNIPIGQGISVTPMQMASMYAPSPTAAYWSSRTWFSRSQGRALPPTRKRII